MKKLISLTMAIIMLTAMATVSITSTSAETTATVNGKTAYVGDKVTVYYYVSSDAKWECFQGYATYDCTGLKLNSFSMPNTKYGSVFYNTKNDGKISYNGIAFDLPFNFTNKKVFFSAEFTVLKVGNYKIQNTWEVIQDVDSVPIVYSHIYDSSRLSCYFVTDIKTINTSQKITAKSFTKTYGSKAFSLGAKSSGNGKLTYSSSDKKVATVSSKGVVTVKGCGKATITIKASATSKYKSASKKVTITVKPAKLKITGYKGSKLIFTPQANVSGYEVKIAKMGSKFKKNLKLSSKSKYLDLKKYSKGDYKIQIRAYKKVSKSTYYGAWGKCQLTLR